MDRSYQLIRVVTGLLLSAAMVFFILMAFGPRAQASGDALTIEGWAYIDDNENQILDRDGTPIGLRADDGEQVVDLPFTFPFYGTDYDQIIVGSNGLLCFDDDGDCDDTDGDISDPSPGPFIAPMWADLDASEDYDDLQIADVFVSEGSVKFHWVTHNIADEVAEYAIEFSATLYEDGGIQFDYGQIQVDEPLAYAIENTVAVGVSDGDGTYIDACVLSFDCFDMHYADSLVFSWDSEADNYDVEIVDNEYDHDFKEYGLEGIMVNIYIDDDDESFEPEADDVLLTTIMTDEFGFFEIVASADGNQDKFWVHITDDYNVASDAGLDFGDDIAFIDFADGDRQHARANFGFEYGSSHIHGFEGWVFEDTNENGVRDRSGTPLPLFIDYEHHIDSENPDNSSYTTVVDLPFEFEFYRKTYEQVHVNLNGMLCFEPDDECSDTADDIREEDFGAIIAPLWAEYTTISEHSIHLLLGVNMYETDDSVTFQWVLAERQDDLPVEFAATLHANGDIVFSYGHSQHNELDDEMQVTIGLGDGEDEEYVDVCDEFFGHDHCENPHYRDSILFVYVEDDDNYLAYPNYGEEYDPHWDASEPGVAGVNVVVADPDDPDEESALSVILTDADGYYSYSPSDDDDLIFTYDVSLEASTLPECMVTEYDDIRKADLDVSEYRQWTQVFFGLIDDPECDDGSTESDDNDGDGALNTVEDAGPNAGDANGDGTLDRDQPNVTSAVNPATGAYGTIGASNGSLQNAQFVEASSLSAQDSGVQYPVGLASFTLDCGTPGCQSTVTITYDQVYDTSGWVFKKFQNGAFTDISSSVTYGTATVGSATVTTATYDLVDGGPLDADGDENGVIVDPAGPSVAGLAETGSPATIAPIYGALIIAAAGAVTALGRRKRSNREN